MPNMVAVAKPLDDEARAAAEVRRRILVDAIARTVGEKNGQSELQRLLVEAGDRRLSLQTVNKWCRGKSPMTEMTLRGVLTVLGLPPTWKEGDPIPEGWRLPRAL